MEVSYKRDFHHSYLILENEEMPDCDAYPVRMLLNGSIPGLLSCSIHRVDNQALFYYEITSKQPLETLCESKKLDRDCMILVIGALMKTIEEMERYLLDPASLLLQPEYIYVNEADREVGFCCWPCSNADEQAFLRFTEFLLPKIDHQDQDAVVLGYQLYRRAMEGRVEPEEIRREIYREVIRPQAAKPEETVSDEEYGVDPLLLEEESRKRQEMMESLLKNPEEEKGIGTGKITFCITLAGFDGVLCYYLLQNRCLPIPVCIALTGSILLVIPLLVLWERIKKKFTGKKGEKKEKEEIKQETAVSEKWDIAKKEDPEIPSLLDDSRTSLLNQPAAAENCGILKALSPPQARDIVLKKGTVILGKMEGAVDIVLPSAAVSRVHAKIKCDQQCEVFDLNSRNGTYVNQIEGVGHEGRILKEGDMISFADVVFQYSAPGNDSLRIRQE